MLEMAIDDFPSDIFNDLLPERDELPDETEEPLFDVRPILRAVTSGDDAPVDEAWPTIDHGNVARVWCERYGKNWRYVSKWGKWLYFNGTRWEVDQLRRINHETRQFVLRVSYWKCASGLAPAAMKELRGMPFVGHVQQDIRSHLDINASPEQWNSDDYLLCTPAGVIDLRTSKLIPARREHYMTKQTSVSPKRMDTPVWDNFLSKFMRGNKEMVDYLYRFGALCLSGDTSNQSLAFFYGVGQNGKGVFLKALLEIMGDYAIAADASVFMASGAEKHPTAIARLNGARAVIVDETEQGMRWNEQRVKRVTGGIKIEAHFMGQDDFEFMPRFKLAMAGNHKPVLRGIGKSMQRRIHLIPCLHVVPDAERDDYLQDKLRAEYPGILAKMIDAFPQWMEMRLSPPDEITAAVADYMDSSDVMGEFIQDRCIQTGETIRNALYQDYRDWMSSRGEKPWSSAAFYSALEERGYSSVRSATARTIKGLSLKQPTPQRSGGWHGED